jgi:alpha-beta hydrolase superfamily lysophospholipase
MEKLLYSLQEFPELPGNLYLPTTTKIKGAVMVLHGSEGGGFGWHDNQAQFLAMHGFASLAFTWCGSPAAPVDGVPNDVINIQLDRTILAFNRLKERVELNGKRFAIYGGSRGAEQALILAALLAEDPELLQPDAVAAHAPSDTYVEGFSWNWQSAGGSEPDDPSARAWFWRGRAVGMVGEPIPIERYTGPVLLSHGLEDDVWSQERTRRLERRLLKAKRNVEAIYLAGERHRLSTKGLHVYREKLIEFLERHL